MCNPALHARSCWLGLATIIFRKIDWATNTNVSGVSLIANGFRVEKSVGDDFNFVLDSGTLTLDTGSGAEDLTSSSVKVSNLFVEIVPASPPVPEALEVSFMLNDRQFATTTRYIR